MGPSQRGIPRLLPLSADAWEAAEELAPITGVTPANFVEGMLLELLLHHRDLELGQTEQSGVIPIPRHARSAATGAADPRRLDAGNL
jgi:hypothetical protein